MARRISVMLFSASAAFAVAVAQEPPDRADADETSGADEELSELDLLSRSADDAFSAAEETAERRPVSVTLRALDKITARYTDIETPIGEPVKFGSLEILPHFCDKRPPEEFPETTAFLEIFDRSNDDAETTNTPSADDSDSGASAAQKTSADAQSSAPSSLREAGARADDDDGSVKGVSRPVDPDRIFSGWMFASSPALNPLEHPVYDVWVIDCKTEPADN